MQVLSNQVFSDKQIVTCSLIAKDFKCNIDEANKIMYEFYQKNRENLEAYFIVVRKDGETKIVIDRIPEQRLNYLLYDQEYSTSIISLKIWAVYDKSQGELEVSNIYEVEDADLHCIQNLCYNLRDLDLKKAEHQAKRVVAATPAKASQTSTKKPQAANNTVDKPKLATPTNPKDNQENAKRANMPEVTNKAHETVKRAKTLEEEVPAKAEEQAKANAKKRKGDDVTPMAEAVGQDKELKKTKTGNIFDSFAQKEPKETKQQKEQKQQKEKEQKEQKEREQREKEQREKEERIQKEKQQKQQQQQKSSKIEVEAEEESYYPDDPDTMVVEKPKQQQQPSKLKTFATFESKKTLTSQSSLSQYDDAFDDPSPIRESVPYREPAKPKQVEKPVEKPVEIFSNEEPQEEFTQVRRVRKVPREKTYMDEKGYLIVENELVDEEYWETVRTKPAAAQNKINNSNNNDTSSKKKAPEKNQATLASFFRKK